MDAASRRVELDELLTHAGWVRRVATRLVRDAGEADDLVQEVWLRALENRPAALESPRGWLGAVARSLAVTRGRAAGRRRRRETIAARAEGLPPADQVVLEAEREREVAALVLALEEPYRSVVLLRFYRDLAPRRIAAELGRPVATVKVQLQRGLERLRKELDRRHGNRESWCALLLPLCRPRAPLALISAVALSLAVGVSALVLWRPAPAPVELARAEPVAPAAALVEPGAEGAFPGATPRSPSARQALAAEPEPERASVAAEPRRTETLHGRLVTLAGEPLAGLRVEARDSRQLAWAQGDAEALVARGFWLPLAPATRAELARSPEARAAFVAAEFPRGGPAADEARTLLAGGTLAPAWALTDARGAFALEVEPGGTHLELVDPGFDLVGWGPPRAALGRESHLYFACESTRLEGRVLDALGGPCVGALVRFSNGCPNEVNAHLALGSGLLCTQRTTHSDAEGRFTLERVPRNRTAELWAEHEGRNATQVLDLFRDEPPAPVTLRIELLPEGERPRLAGTVLRPDGKAARGATLLLAGSRAVADEEGAFELVLASPAEEAELVVFEPGFDPLVVPGFGAGLSSPGVHPVGTLRLPATRLVLAGRVLDATGAPLADVQVELFDATGIDGLDGTLESLASGATGRRTDAEGRFELGGLLPREYRIRVPIAGEFGPFRAGAGELRLVVEKD